MLHGDCTQLLPSSAFLWWTENNGSVTASAVTTTIKFQQKGNSLILEELFLCCLSGPREVHFSAARLPMQGLAKNDTNDNAAIPLWTHFTTECLWAKWPNCHNKSLAEFQLSLAKSVHANKQLGSALSTLSGCYDTEGKVLIWLILHCNLCPDKEIHVSYCEKVKHVIEVMLLQHDWGYCNLRLGWGTLEGLATFGTNVLVQVSTQKSLLMWNTKIFRGIIFQIIIQIITPKIHCDCVTIVIRHSQTLPANPPTVDALNEATVWHSNSEVSKAMDILLMSPKQWPD